MVTATRKAHGWITGQLHSIELPNKASENLVTKENSDFSILLHKQPTPNLYMVIPRFYCNFKEMLAFSPLQ